MSAELLFLYEAYLLFCVYMLWVWLKIGRTYDVYTMSAIDFIFEGNDWPEKLRWHDSLDAARSRAVWHPFCLPSHCIQGEYAAEFFRWLKGKKQDRAVIQAAMKEAA